ncbi:hypothetical protein QBC38DRAFT_458554 [Podospora fimiseda]|uniref:Uncharacterized protein n=1 Tax=Podospora fimiseda TaxID=252190 RepID=A0AAN7BJ28_9PEZI|nr:hypothetical protein QBC38DRAFT_458554 [Podospora fimiseda]
MSLVEQISRRMADCELVGRFRIATESPRATISDKLSFQMNTVVDVSSGALLMKLTHLCTLKSSPEEWSPAEDGQLSTIQLWRSLNSVLPAVKILLETHAIDLSRFFPGIESIRANLEVIDALLRNASESDLIEIYRTHMHSRFQAGQDAVLPGCQVFKVSVDDQIGWERDYDGFLDSSMAWKDASDEDLQSESRWIRAEGRPILRKPMLMVVSNSIFFTFLYERISMVADPETGNTLAELRKAYWATGGKSLADIWEQSEPFGPGISCPGWPIELLQNFEITGNPVQVKIY